jgi:hypothetical protein
MSLSYAVGPVTYRCACGNSGEISLPPFTAMTELQCRCGTVVRLQLEDECPRLRYTRPLPLDIQARHTAQTGAEGLCPACGAYWGCEHRPQ